MWTLIFFLRVLSDGNDFSCRSSPSFTCWQVPSRPVFYLHLSRVNWSESRDGVTTPGPAASRSSARTAEPAGMDGKSGTSALLSLISKFVFPVPAGTGTISVVNVSVVFISHAGACVFTQTSNESRADEGCGIELNILRFRMFFLPSLFKL